MSELVLEVVDLEASEALYAGVLGLPVVERWPNREALGVAVAEHTFGAYADSRAAYVNDPDGHLVEFWT